eukprot:938879_1
MIWKLMEFNYCKSILSIVLFLLCIAIAMLMQFGFIFNTNRSVSMIASSTSNTQNETKYNSSFIQGTMNRLVADISRHDYSNFNGISNTQNETKYNSSFIQGTMNRLVADISRHDYSNFNGISNTQNETKYNSSFIQGTMNRLVADISRHDYSNFNGISNTQNETKYNSSFIQGTMNRLVADISRHDYSNFNGDVRVGNHTFKRYSGDMMLRTFSNKIILFYGDSTLHYYTHFIAYCLLYYLKMKPVHINSSIRVDKYCIQPSSLLVYDARSSANRIIRTHVELFNDTTLIDRTNLIQHVNAINSTVVYYNHNQNNSPPDLVVIHRHKPDIIVYNPYNLHLLHLIPTRPFEGRSRDVIHHFEEYLLKVYRAAVNISARCIIYRSASPLCLSHDTNKAYTNVRSVYQKGNGSLYDSYLGQCYSQNQNDTEACKHWTFTNQGVQFSNSFIEKFVTKAQNGVFGNYTNVFYYDRYHLFHSEPHVCKKEAHDVLHWVPSFGADTMYLTNFVNFACKS